MKDYTYICFVHIKGQTVFIVFYRSADIKTAQMGKTIKFQKDSFTPAELKTPLLN